MIPKEIFKITFYFTSGLSEIRTYSEEELNEIIKNLKKSWMQMCMSNYEYGINFAHVTHYEIRKGI